MFKSLLAIKNYSQPFKITRKLSFSIANYVARPNSSSKTGYVVLLPEVPTDTIETNPILKINSIPEFENIDRKNWRNAIVKLSIELEAKIWSLEEKIKKNPGEIRSIDEFSNEIDSTSVPLDYIWSLLKILSISRQDEIPPEGYLKLHERAQVARSKKYQSKIFYNTWKDLSLSKLSSPESRLVSKYLTEGELSGICLTGTQRALFENINENINKGKYMYKRNYVETTNRFSHLVVDQKYLGDMPPEGLIALSKTKEGRESNGSRGPWVVKLSSPSYDYFMEYCPERALRWNAWKAHVSRASGQADKNVGNSIHIEDIRANRAALAKLLGYDSFADMSMLTKMAGNVENVKTMIASLFVVACPKQSDEIGALQSFAESRGFEHKLKLWDIPYWRRKQRKYLYNVDQSIVSSYFSYPNVKSKLFEFASHLFGISINKEDKVGWNKDVEFYSVSDKGGLIGNFFIDPYARQGKMSGGGWMVCNRPKFDSLTLKPLASLIFNFNEPMYGKPSLLTFSQLSLLLEKFGSMLQHLLTTVPYPEISGTTSIEWDAVKVVGEFMKMWLGNKEFMSSISGHFESGDKIPDQILGDLLRSHKHLAAYDLSHQLYLSDLDIELYSGSSNEFWMDVMKRLWSLYKSSSGLLLDPIDTHPCNFPAIFSGDYPSAFYSSLWSQMLAADIYTSFVLGPKKNLQHWANEGARFRSSYLSLGAGYHPSEVFRQFRGRDPSPDALLWTKGLKSSLNSELESENTTESKINSLSAKSS